MMGQVMLSHSVIIAVVLQWMILANGNSDNQPRMDSKSSHKILSIRSVNNNKHLRITKRHANFNRATVSSKVKNSSHHVATVAYIVVGILAVLFMASVAIIVGGLFRYRKRLRSLEGDRDMLQRMVLSAQGKNEQDGTTVPSSVKASLRRERTKSLPTAQANRTFGPLPTPPHGGTSSNKLARSLKDLRKNVLRSFPFNRATRHQKSAEPREDDYVVSAVIRPPTDIETVKKQQKEPSKETAVRLDSRWSLATIRVVHEKARQKLEGISTGLRRVKQEIAADIRLSKIPEESQAEMADECSSSESGEAPTRPSKSVETGKVRSPETLASGALRRYYSAHATEAGKLPSSNPLRRTVSSGRELSGPQAEGLAKSILTMSQSKSKTRTTPRELTEQGLPPTKLPPLKGSATRRKNGGKSLLCANEIHVSATRPSFPDKASGISTSQDMHINTADEGIAEASIHNSSDLAKSHIPIPAVPARRASLDGTIYARMGPSASQGWSAETLTEAEEVLSADSKTPFSISDLDVTQSDPSSTNREITGSGLSSDQSDFSHSCGTKPGLLQMEKSWGMRTCGGRSWQTLDGQTDSLCSAICPCSHANYGDTRAGGRGSNWLVRDYSSHVTHVSQQERLFLEWPYTASGKPQTYYDTTEDHLGDCNRRARCVYTDDQINRIASSYRSYHQLTNSASQYASYYGPLAKGDSSLQIREDPHYAAANVVNTPLPIENSISSNYASDRSIPSIVQYETPVVGREVSDRDDRDNGSIKGSDNRSVCERLFARDSALIPVEVIEASSRPEIIVSPTAQKHNTTRPSTANIPVPSTESDARDSSPIAPVRPHTLEQRPIAEESSTANLPVFVFPANSTNNFSSVENDNDMKTVVEKEMPDSVWGWHSTNDSRKTVYIPVHLKVHGSTPADRVRHLVKLGHERALHSHDLGQQQRTELEPQP